MRSSPPLPFRLWRIAAGTSAAIQTAAHASDLVLRRLQPSHGGNGHGPITEMLELAREVQGCDVRLGLLGSDHTRNIEFRHELEKRRTHAAERLAELEAEHGLPSAEDPPEPD